MAFSYNKKNLANTTITGAITPTQTSVTVADATVFSYAFFYATLMPSNEMSNASNSEIVLVTNIQGNTLTLVRGQENTIARSFPYGAVITNGIYTRDIDYARSIGRKVFMARDDGTDDTNTSYQIVDPMIKNIPEEGSIITVEFNVPSYGAPTLGVNNGIGGLVQVSGSNIHITDSSGQIDSVEMYGDTEQTTYSGKNLLDESLMEQGTFNYLNNQESAHSGIIRMSSFIPCQSNTTYTISSNAILGEFAVVYKDSNGNVVEGSGWSIENRTYTSFTTKSNAVQMRVRVGKGSYPHTAGVDYALQIELGNQPTSYEPYVGGTASPNPDYPQNVNVVTGEQSVEIRGSKNLLPFTNQNFTKNNITFSVTDGTLYLDGTSTGETLPGDQIWKNNFAFTLQAGTYTLSLNTVTTATYIKKMSDNTDLATVNGNSTKKATFTITEPTEVYLGFYMYNLSFSNLATTYQLELGSTATTYEPYKGVTKTVNLGKNLFDKDNYSVLSGYFNGTTNITTPGYTRNRIVYIPCTPNTTYSVTFPTTDEVHLYTKSVATTAETPANSVAISGRVNAEGTSNKIENFTTNSSAKYLCLYLQGDPNVDMDTYIADIAAKIQIEKGSTATTYAPYFTPIELCKIGTYQDKIYKSGDDWYVHKEIKKVDLSTISYDGAGNGNFYNIGFGTVQGYNPSIPQLSNCFTYASTTWAGVGKFGIATGTGNLWMTITDASVQSEDAPAWLKNRGAIMYGVLRTPTDTKITNSALIAQLEALYNMLPEGVADVVVTGDLPGSLTIKYYQQGTGTYTAPIVGGAEIDGGDNEQVVELDSYLPYRLVYDTNGYWRVLNKGPKVTTGAIADGSVTNAKLNVDWGDIDDLYYQSGDVVSSGDGTTYVEVFNGFLTTGNSELTIVIPMSKRLDNITSAAITALNGDYRCQGAYLTGNGTDITTLSSQTITISKATNTIIAKFTKTSGNWGATNNSTVSLGIKTFSITLS